jgi:hypothetical protein
MVCAGCGEVKGPVRDRDELAWQFCSCDPPGKRKPRPSSGRDFNRWVDLCHCCELKTISSGRRGSLLQCRECLVKVKRLNVLAGRCVIPISCHSLMNGVELNDPALASTPALEAYTDQIKAFRASCADLSSWAGSVVRAHLEVMGYDAADHVYLDRYLRRARQLGLAPANAFRALLGLALRPDEADLLAQLCEVQENPTRKASPISRILDYGTWRDTCSPVAEMWRPPDSKRGG